MTISLMHMSCDVQATHWRQFSHFIYVNINKPHGTIVNELWATVPVTDFARFCVSVLNPAAVSYNMLEQPLLQQNTDSVRFHDCMHV